jgi:hypothetical protein
MRKDISFGRTLFVEFTKAIIFGGFVGGVAVVVAVLVAGLLLEWLLG